MDTTILRSNLNSARMTCGLAQRPEYRDLMTAASKLTGERVNRLCKRKQCYFSKVNCGALF